MFEGKNFALIKANRLFAGTVQKIKISISNKDLLSLRAGDTIFKKDDTADALYLVISGEVKVEVPGIFKKPVIVTKKANDFFGEKELFEGYKRKGNAKAASNCNLCILKKEKVDKLISQDKQVFVNLYGHQVDISDHVEGFAFNPDAESTDLSADIQFDKEEFVSTEEEIIDSESEVLQAEMESFLENEDILDEIDSDLILETGEKEEEVLESDELKQEEIDLDQLLEASEFSFDDLDKSIDDDRQLILQDELDQQKDIQPVLEIKEESSDQDIGVEYDLLKELKALQDNPVPFDEIDFDKPESFEVSEEEVNAGEEDLHLDDIQETEQLVSDDEILQEVESPVPEAEAPVTQTTIPEEPEATKELKEEPSSPPETAAKDETKKPEPVKVKKRKEKDAVKPVEPVAEKSDIPEPISENVTGQEMLDTLISDRKEKITEPAAAEVSATVTEPVESVTGETPPEDSVYQNELSEEVDEMTAAQFKQLLEAAQKINSSIKLDETLESILGAAKKLTGAEHGYLFLIDRDTNELWAKSLNNEVLIEKRLKLGEDIAGISAVKNQIINLKNPYKDARFNKDRDKQEKTKTKNLLCFPIVNKNGYVTAVLQLSNSSKGEFTTSDEEALSALSMNISLALENAELIEKQLQNDRLSSMGKMANFLIQDIKKPVLTIKYYAEHIKKKEVSSDVVQILNMLIEQSNAVVDLVQTTLSYSEGKGILRAQPMRISTVLNDIFNLLAEYVESRHVNLYKKYEVDAVVNIDKREFYQACFQIVKNACDAMPGGGDIYVTVKIDHNFLKIEFKDSGLGIPESIKNRIFEPFMSHGKKQGVGLGLAIADKIVKDHTGSISFESEIGEGTTFIISLPYISVV